ncbi:hypothetical protein [Bacillus sp. ISL-46]|uniref:hypothetical protein n=1 Tax=Bacillus sp. ISL-46 TaxID=2819129 RepID=UPI001BE89DA4|nr:hypothetical protein [Bacillus sp. ISL-46]MBT2724432.1 hypothetical protein [Bacillus sp. ISL-46]
MVKKKVVYLEENMLNDNDLVVFEADIPYVVEKGFISNENNEIVLLRDIWVDFRLVHQQIS